MEILRRSVASVWGKRITGVSLAWRVGLLSLAVSVDPKLRMPDIWFHWIDGGGAILLAPRPGTEIQGATFQNFTEAELRKCTKMQLHPPWAVPRGQRDVWVAPGRMWQSITPRHTGDQSWTQKVALRLIFWFHQNQKARFAKFPK